jgi:class 3 adenylate cyclase
VTATLGPPSAAPASVGPASTQGRAEVDETLRVARDAVEKDIARYRLLVFGAVFVQTGIFRIIGLDHTWWPTFVFTGALLYATGVRAYLARRGNPPALAIVAVVCDVTAGLAPLHLALRQGRTPSDLLFICYIAGPAIILALFISALRNNPMVSWTGSIVGVTLYLAAVPATLGFHPGQLAVSLMILLTAVVGSAAAKQARKSLDIFARLHLLRRYVPKGAVERVMDKDASAALSLGGRLVTVTLLAADLRGFTAMSEGLEPNEVMTQLNAYHGVMIEVIERNGGSIDKFIGDGTLVVFGLSGAPEAAAKNAVTCAREMISALEVHNGARSVDGAAPLAMGIGIHTGPVIAGNLGVPGKRLEFTVIGDAVNTASRLEGHTKEAGSPVVISEETVALLPSKEGLRELAPVVLRGKVASLGVFGLSSPDAPPT